MKPDKTKPLDASILSEYKKGDKQNTAYDFIRSAIMKDQFGPNYPLIENELSEMMDGMSRTPIRNALLRLEHEGLIERIPGKGLFVTQISITDLLEITELRFSLETTAVRLFVERADPSMRKTLKETLAAHKKSHAAGDDLEAVSYDNAFHYTLAKGSMNNHLYNVVYRLIEESSRGAFITKSDRKRVEMSIGQHQKIVEAIDENDADKAALCITKHLEDWIEYIKDIQFKKYYLFRR